jgi:hypothetical protein
MKAQSNESAAMGAASIADVTTRAFEKHDRNSPIDIGGSA